MNDLLVEIITALQALDIWNILDKMLQQNIVGIVTGNSLACILI